MVGSLFVWGFMEPQQIIFNCLFINNFSEIFEN